MNPTLIIDAVRVRHNAERFIETARASFGDVQVRAFFATKANAARPVIEALVSTDFGCEVMTVADLETAREHGLNVIVSGFVKSKELLRRAIATHVEYLVLENSLEIERIIELAEHQVRPRVLVRIKNDDKSKVGCSLDEFAQIAQLEELDIRGVHLHAGWNLRNEDRFRTLVERLVAAKEVIELHGRACSILNFGGSFCEHDVDPAQLRHRFELCRAAISDSTEEVHFEPGRYVVGDAGHLLCMIEFVDSINHCLHLNTCAYGYALTGATPAIRLEAQKEGTDPVCWRLHGFWPSEADTLNNAMLIGTPRVGDTLVLLNMGAYSLGLESQFSAEQPICVTYRRVGDVSA